MSEYPKHFEEAEAYFPYVDLVDDETQKQLLEAAQGAIAEFKIQATSDGRELASQINRVVDEILRTGEIPSGYNGDKMTVAVELGALYGFALNMGYGWKWKKVGAGPDQLRFDWGVGPDDDNYYNPCGVFLGKILLGKNTGLDGKNDNTVLLLYNMIGETVKKTPARKLTVLW